MQKKWIPWATAALILTIVLCVGIRLWASGQAASLTGPTHLESDGNGHIFVGLSDRLLVFSDGGDFIERIPLSRFGVEELIGDFWVDGHDILLRSALPEGGIARTLRVLLRFGGQGTDEAADNQTVLQKCTLDTGVCGSFAPALRSTRTFHLWQEKPSGAVLVADTAQHRLLRLQADGTLEAAGPAVLKFPNGLLLAQDGLLYVADTNHHRVVAVNPARADFAEEKHDFPVSTGDSTAGNVWPTGIAQAKDGTLWTINGNTNLAFGDVMIYETNGKFRHKVQLPVDADPIALLATGDGMLVADAARFEIHAFDLQGHALTPFGHKAMRQEMDAVKNAKARFQAISTGAFIALIGLCLAVAGLYEMAKRKGLV